MADEKNILEMSDEDIAAMAEPDSVIPVTEEEGTTDATPDTKVEDVVDLGGEPSEDIPDLTSNQDEKVDPTDTDTTDIPDKDGAAEAEADKEVASAEAAKDGDKTGKVDADKEDGVNYKAEYERLLAPFKANGKDIQIQNVDDALSLMKMGANYNKKMAGLKPVLKLVKMLENNELMDEGKLSYLIDLSKKNPEAIKKLVKESGLDPLAIDTEKDTEYKPNTYTVNDNEVDLDAVLDDIRDTPTFKDTIDIISNKWDESSKKVLLATPSIIKSINDHVAQGVYEKIAQVMESERMLGRLQGLSDLEAYKQVGDAIQAQGGFGAPNTQPDANVSKKTDDVTAKPDPNKLKNRKKAASSARTASTAKPQKDFNPLALSDEEFEKAASKFT